jgi:IclR family pca regulon transcriptional regulator
MPVAEVLTMTVTARTRKKTSERRPRKRGTAYTVRSLVRGLSILAQLADAPLRLTDLSVSLKVDKATLFRYCSTLIELKYLELDPASKTYSLGPMAHTLGYAALTQNDVHAAIRTYLHPLAARFHGSSSFGMLDGLETVYIDRAVAEGALIYAMSPGARLPATTSSMGKMLLADRPEAERARLLSAAHLEARARSKLERELARANEKGYALNLGGFRRGLNAASVLGRERLTKKTLGAIMVASYEMTEDDLVHKVVPVLREVTDAATRGELFNSWGRGVPVLASAGGRGRS